MNAFNKRFFVLIALIFLGFTAISFKKINLIFFPIFVIFIGIFYFVASKFKKQNKNLKLFCILLVCASILGILCSNLLVLKNNKVVEKYTGEHIISGYVAEVSSNQSYMSEYVVRVEAVDYQKVSIDLVLVADYQCDLSRGDFFELKGILMPLENYKDLLYVKNKNFYDYPLICSIDDRVEIKLLSSEFRLALVLTNMNSRMSSTLKNALGKESGSLASALLLGNRELLSDDTLRDFKRAGVYHMLALSGLHVAILIGVVDWLLKKLLVPRSVRLCVLTSLSLFYVALTGFALSACRSMLMLYLMYISLTVGKRRDSMTALFFAVFVIVLISPSAVLDLGLQLSFLSTFGVVCSTLITEKMKWFTKEINGDNIKAILSRLLRKFVHINIASLCVFISTLPMIMIYFGEVSLATFVSNIFMGVICEWFMVLSLLSLIFSWNPYLCFPFAELSSRIGEIMMNTVSFISDIEGVMLSLLYPGIEILVLGLFIGFLLLLTVRLRNKLMIFIPSIAFALLLCINIVAYNSSREGFVRVEYLCGESIVLSSSEEVYICDASKGSYGSLYNGVTLAKENCFTEIDGLILTHYHSKHVVSVERLIKINKVHSVLLPMPQNKEEDYVMRSLIRVLEKEDVLVYIYDNARELDVLSGKLAISPRAYIAGYAHPSVALSFAYKDKRLTLIERPYFNTYLEKSGVFKEYIESSDYLIFGADGRDPQNDFRIYSSLKEGCEISFSDFELFEKSDFEAYIETFDIFFNVGYKKYDLK